MRHIRHLNVEGEEHLVVGHDVAIPHGLDALHQGKVVATLCREFLSGQSAVLGG